MRLVYGAGLALAVWVAGWGLFAPDQIERAAPWTLPPLHARFVGALYLSGAVCMLGMLLTRRWSRQAVIAPMIAIWTGVLLVVLLLHFDTVGGLRDTVVVWLVAYTVLPVTETLRAWRHRHERGGAEEGGRNGGADKIDAGRVPPWLRRTLLGQGAVVSVLSVAMLFAPGVLAAGWPWPAPALAIQIYAGPLLAYGVGSIIGARRATIGDLAILVPALATFALATLIISVGHAGTFLPRPATWLWFGLFGAAAVLYGWLTVRRHPRTVVVT